MVTVVRGFDRGESIGNAIGSGLQALAPLAKQQAQTKYDRGLLQEGLEEARAGMTPEMQQRLGPTLDIMKAYAGIPGSDRALSTLLPEISRQRQFDEARSLTSPGASQEQQMGSSNVGMGQQLPGFLGRSGSGIQQNQNTNQIGVPQGRGEGSLIPTALGEGLVGEKYTPEQIRSDPIRAPYMIQYNDQVDQQASQIAARAQESGNISQLRASQQQAAREVFKEKAPSSGISGEDVETLLKLRLNPEIQKLGNYDEQFDAARKAFNLLDKTKYDLKRLATDNYSPEEFTRNVKTLKNSVEPMIKAGMRDEVEGMLKSDLGLGDVNTAMLTNNFTPEMYQSASHLPSYGNYTNEVLSLPEGAPKGEYEKLGKEKEKIDQQWKKWIKKTIKPGKFDINDPNRYKQGTSLLIARDLADQKQMPWQNFNELMQDMVSKKEIELDERQMNELAKLGRSPELVEGWGEALFNIGRLFGIGPQKKTERRR